MRTTVVKRIDLWYLAVFIFAAKANCNAIEPMQTFDKRGQQAKDYSTIYPISFSEVEFR